MKAKLAPPVYGTNAIAAIAITTTPAIIKTCTPCSFIGNGFTVGRFKEGAPNISRLLLSL